MQAMNLENISKFQVYAQMQTRNFQNGKSKKNKKKHFINEFFSHICKPLITQLQAINLENI